MGPVVCQRIHGGITRHQAYVYVIAAAFDIIGK